MPKLCTIIVWGQPPMNKTFSNTGKPFTRYLLTSPTGSHQLTSPCLAEGHVGELDDLAGKVLDVLHVHLHDVLRSSDAKGLR